VYVFTVMLNCNNKVHNNAARTSTESNLTLSILSITTNILFQ